MASELKEAVGAARISLRMLKNSLRAATQAVAQLEDALDNAQAEEVTANGTEPSYTHTR
jgi:hypothetical protein